MSSRQEEKERRRRERIEREQAAARAAARRRRLQMAFGGVLVAALIAGVVVIGVIGLGGDDAGGSGPSNEASADLPTLPEPQTADLTEAAKAAGCKLLNAKDEGANHENRDFTIKDYGTNPPTSGNHFPEPAEDGIYDPGNTAPLGQTVHSLEHGRINVQYKAGTSEGTVKQLEALYAENGGYHLLLYENTTNMPFAVAATAWLHQLGCPTMNDKVFDALRTFRDRYIDKGPEKVP
jgi:hypothetical protein